MKLARVLLPLLAALSLTAAPPVDPFSVPEETTDAPASPESALPAQVSLQFDWIKLPHLMANQLLRRHLQHSTDGDALYGAVQELIVQKKAERLDLNALVVRSGQRSKVEAIIEKAYATEFDPPQVNDRITVGGDTITEPISPVTPSRFSIRPIGHTAEAEATVDEDGRIIDLNLAPEWNEHLTEWAWGTGVSEIKQPVFGTAKISTQLLAGNGEWEFVGLFTPPWLPEAGKPPGCAPLPPDRMFLFVRASTGRKLRENSQAPANGVRQVTVLAEWIETDTAVASALLGRHPAFADSSALREALELMFIDGRARLLESAALPIRGGQRSRIESITSFPYPREHEPSRGPSTFVEKQSVPAAAPIPRRAMVTPVTHHSFSFRNLGATLEMEATIGEDGAVIDLNCAPELVFLTGFDSHGTGLSETKQPRFQTMKTTCLLRARPGAPSMIAAFDAPITDDKAQPHTRSRKVLLFIRAIL